MFNVLYDFSNLLPVRGSVSATNGHACRGHVNGTPSGFPALSSGDTTRAIAYQFILGGAMSIPSVRGLGLTAGYSFLGVGSRSYNVSAIAAPGEAAVPAALSSATTSIMPS